MYFMMLLGGTSYIKQGLWNRYSLNYTPRSAIASAHTIILTKGLEMENISVNVKASSGYIQLSYGHIFKDSVLVNAGKELVRAAKVEHYVCDVKMAQSKTNNTHDPSVRITYPVNVNVPHKLIQC
ncbi:hypothetical protein K7432_016527 [Basidiobolus ranarum]|uniref:Uncharacterized protein n=1 Tax=Basidiobolus ranarum TaxID=34480 RepID=A0ABR2WEK3_9FUNG